MESFNKNSNESNVNGSNRITKKIPIKRKTDQILKQVSNFECIGFGRFARAKITRIGVKTPTIYKGDKNGEIFFRK